MTLGEEAGGRAGSLGQPKEQDGDEDEYNPADNVDEEDEGEDDAPE